MPMPRIPFMKKTGLACRFQIFTTFRQNPFGLVMFLDACIHTEQQWILQLFSVMTERAVPQVAAPRMNRFEEYVPKVGVCPVTKIGILCLILQAGRVLPVKN